MKKRQGTVLIEVIISMFIFAISMLSLSASLTFALKTISDSMDTTTAQMSVINKAEIFIAKRSIQSDDIRPSGEFVTQLSSSEISIGSGDLKLDIYRYKQPKIKISSIYTAVDGGI